MQLIDVPSNGTATSRIRTVTTSTQNIDIPQVMNNDNGDSYTHTYKSSAHNCYVYCSLRIVERGPEEQGGSLQSKLCNVSNLCVFLVSTDVISDLPLFIIATSSLFTTFVKPLRCNDSQAAAASCSRSPCERDVGQRSINAP